MRLPPVSRQTLSALFVSLWAILIGGVRIFAWDSLKDGFIDVRPLSRVARLLALSGIAIVLVFVASIYFNDPLRWAGTLELLPLGSTTARSLFVPTLAVPIAYLATILAWTFLLTGALHVMAVVRWGTLICLLLFELPGLFLGVVQGANFDSPTLALLFMGLIGLDLIGLVLTFLVLPRVRLPLAVEFTLLLALVSGFFVLSLYAAVASSQSSAINFVGGYLVYNVVTDARILIIPFLYLAGAEMMNFGISFTRWGAQAAQAFGKARVIPILLFALLVYRWLDLILNQVLPGVSAHQLQAWGGALLAGIVFVPLAIWRARHAFEDRVPLKLVVGLILVALAPQLLVILLINLATALFLTRALDPNVMSNMTQTTNFLQTLSTSAREALYLIMAGAGLITTAFALRRKRYTVAAYGMLLAWMQLVAWFMEKGRPLQDYTYHYRDLEPWIVLALTALGVYWYGRRKMDTSRALTLLSLTFFAWVLNFVDFLDNPLSLFFGFAGIFFTVFGILWGVITAGGKFANFDSRRFPRLNRILLYLGYTLLTINITHWFTVTHDVEQQASNADITLSGLRIFGYTAAYLVIVEGGRALLKRES